MNVRLTIGGREVQVTLRDSDETHLLQRLETLLARYPVPHIPVQASSTAEAGVLCIRSRCSAATRQVAPGTATRRHRAGAKAADLSPGSTAGPGGLLCVCAC